MDFQAMTPGTLGLARIRSALRDGRPGTAMKPFAGVITEDEQAAVAAFVHDEFVVRKARNTRYHTEANGWPQHERYRDAYPFALGEVALTVPPETLDPALRRGRALFMETCISCHDRGKPVADPVAWESRPLSYPRNNYDHRNPAVDASTSATPFRIHDTPPKLERPTPAQSRGERIFQENCAFCHAADGTGKNWIGAFLEPHPRDLTDPRFRASTSRERYRAVIRSGLPGSSMPAWRDVLTDAQIEDLISYIEVGFNGKTIVSAPRPGG
jgi:cytochrome c oxidase cbb3-type subunit III